MEERHGKTKTEKKRTLDPIISSHVIIKFTSWAIKLFNFIPMYGIDLIRFRWNSFNYLTSLKLQINKSIDLKLFFMAMMVQICDHIQPRNKYLHDQQQPHEFTGTTHASPIHIIILQETCFKFRTHCSCPSMAQHRYLVSD